MYFRRLALAKNVVLSSDGKISFTFPVYSNLPPGQYIVRAVCTSDSVTGEVVGAQLVTIRGNRILPSTFSSISRKCDVVVYFLLLSAPSITVPKETTPPVVTDRATLLWQTNVPREVLRTFRVSLMEGNTTHGVFRKDLGLVDNQFADTSAASGEGVSISTRSSANTTSISFAVSSQDKCDSCFVRVFDPNNIIVSGDSPVFSILPPAAGSMANFLVFFVFFVV